jgi:hypothetical protein
MAMFKAFKPSGMEKIARSMGYQGNMQGFQDYIAQDPMRQQQMQNYTNQAMQMAKGGAVRKMREGGVAAGGINPLTGTATTQAGGIIGNPLTQAALGAVTQVAANSPQFGQIAKQTTAAFGEEDGQQLPELPDGKFLAKTMAVGEDDPNPNPPQKYLTRALGEDGNLHLAVTKALGEQPGDGPLFNATTQAVGEEDNLAPVTLARGENIAEPLPSPGLGQPVTINGITYNSATRAVGETTSPPPPPNQPLQQAYVPKQEFKQVEKPKMDTNQFLADGTTPNPNYMKPVTDAEGNVLTEMTAPTIGDVSAQMMQSPGLPEGATVVAQGINTEAGQMIPSTSGQVSGAVATPTAMATTTFAQGPQESEANVMQAATAAPAVNTAINATQAAQGSVDPQAEVLAAQQTATSVGNVNAAQGNATLMNNPVQRQIQQGELISGAANAQTAAQFAEQIQAAQATPSQQATVQGQLANLTANFDGTNPPPWAAGALRSATAQMAARGLGASSLAGQAIIQATIESALPIAQADASVFAQFEQQNLSNRQQRSMLAAQQRAQFMGQEFDQAFQSRVANAARIGDIANMNFTAEQQVALENSRIANSMNLANLSNRQGVVMAEAAALSQMDMANLSNRQQAAVMNAQNFMQMDMANLSNQQQTELFNAQQRVQALFNDQSAVNAARQFNATSQNQVDQFFASLANNVSQFNATQANAQSQYNAGQRNVVERFNAELNNQRDQFNATNRLVIDQSNAQWRRQVATVNNATVNRANELNASAVLGVSQQAYNNLWQYYGDSMEWAWTSAENERSRIVNLAIEQLRADSSANIQDMKNDYASSAGFGSLIGTFLTASSSSMIGKLFGF